MAKVKRAQGQCGRPLEVPAPVHEAEHGFEPADFELDERLRTLRLDQWFAMVEEGMPLWVC